jgi:hypothetical protein
MAFTEHLKSFPWFCFKKPSEITEQVEKVILTGNQLLEIDYARMDMNNSYELNEMFDDLQCMLFIEDEDEYRTLAKNQRNSPGTLTVGEETIEFETEEQTGSGGAYTASGNSTKNAMIRFVSSRMHGYSYEQTVNLMDNCSALAGDDSLLGAGDDSTEVNAYVKAYVKAAEIFGHIAEVKIVDKRYEVPMFLARYFFGGGISCADIKRAVSKLHLTAGLPLSDWAKAYEKAISILVNDYNTPILREWSLRVIDLAPRHLNKKQAAAAERMENKLGNYHSTTCPGDHFYNPPSNLYLELLEATFPEFNYKDFVKDITTLDPLKLPGYTEAIALKPGKDSAIDIKNDVLIKGTAKSPKVRASLRKVFRPRK